MDPATVNEGTTAYLTVTFKDKAGANAAPASATYRIDCLTTGAAIKATTPLSAGASVEITLTKTDNRIVTAANVREQRRVTVVGTYGADDQVQHEYDYDVLNLKFV